MPTVVPRKEAPARPGLLRLNGMYIRVWLALRLLRLARVLADKGARWLG